MEMSAHVECCCKLLCLLLLLDATTILITLCGTVAACNGLHPNPCSPTMQAASFGVGSDVTPPDCIYKETGRLAERMLADFAAGRMGACITSLEHPCPLANAAGGHIE